MHKKEFDSSFVGFTEDGAKWVVENTDIKLCRYDTNWLNSEISPIFFCLVERTFNTLLYKTNKDSISFSKTNGYCACIELLSVWNVGTDYFSIATYDEAIPAHVAFLKGMVCDNFDLIYLH